MKLAAMVLALAGCAGVDAEPKAPVGGAPLVLELFTSQGCSSCPPADRLMADLAKTSDRAIVPIAFHVDYWNDLGWADPFSTAEWTARQRQYAIALQGGVYTPELVVGGAAAMVGSSRGQVVGAIAAAPRVEPLVATATWHAGSVDVAATAPAGAEVYVAVWEATTSTAVPRGENAGETLVSDRVVRRFARVAAAGQHGAISLPIDARWRGVGAVAFAQAGGGAGQIVASALLPR